MSLTVKQQSDVNSQSILETLIKLWESDRRYFSVAEAIAASGLSRKEVNNALRMLMRAGAVVRDAEKYADGFHYRPHQEAWLNYKAEQKRLSKPQAVKCSPPPITRYYVNPRALREGVEVERLDRDRVETYIPQWEVA